MVPTCPHCNKEIDALLNTIEGRQTFMVYKGPVEGDITFENEEFDPIGEQEWSCPECGENICTSRDDAEDFLWKKGYQTIKATLIRSTGSMTIVIGTAVEVIKQDVNFGLAGVVKSMQGCGEKTIVMVDFKREGEPAIPYWMEDLKLAGDTGEDGEN